MYLKKHPDTTHTKNITTTVTSLNCTPSSSQLVNCLVNLSYTYNNSTYTLTNILLQNQKSANIATVGIYINLSNPMNYILAENHTSSMTGTYYIVAGIVVFIVSAILLVVVVMKSDVIAAYQFVYGVVITSFYFFFFFFTILSNQQICISEISEISEILEWVIPFPSYIPKYPYHPTKKLTSIRSNTPLNTILLLTTSFLSSLSSLAPASLKDDTPL